MWNPSKKILLFLIFTCTILAAVSYRLIDWNNYEKGTSNAIKELRLTLVFLGLAFYFIFPYVKKIKSNKA
jgi:hypothetical protein